MSLALRSTAMSLRPSVTSVGFFLIVDRGWFDHRLDDAALAAQLARHARVTDWLPRHHSDVVADFEDWIFAEVVMTSAKRWSVRRAVSSVIVAFSAKHVAGG